MKVSILTRRFSNASHFLRISTVIYIEYTCMYKIYIKINKFTNISDSSTSSKKNYN